MIWFTSDLHFCHNKPFLYEPRGFTSVYDMNEAIIKNWNSVVNDGDLVYVLGDLMLNDNEEGRKCFNQLRGQKFIILGNHDTDNRVQIYETQLWGVMGIHDAIRIKENGYNFFLCHYPTLTSNHDYNKPLNHRLISLCGHTHTKDKFADWDKGYIYHCELDAHNNYPVSIDKIIEDIELKEYGKLSKKV